MATKKFKQVFLVRFITYFMVLTGLSAITFEFGPVAWAEFTYRKDQLLGIEYTLPPLIQTSQTLGQGGESTPSATQASPEPQAETGFGDLAVSENIIKPVSTEYGIVIEKINANAKVVPNVNPANQTEYMNALSMGVAEAQGSTTPGQSGNLFLFSHSTDAPWNIIRYNAVFYLLSKLETGDRISIFYNNRRYDYSVYDKTVAKPEDISFLTNRYDKPVLTLQTCDPPGTILNRLVVRAKLVGS